MSQINNSYIEEYIRELLPARPEFLEEIEAYAKREHIPILEAESAQFLRVLLQVHRPKKILEVGTAIGYSALLMAETLEGETSIISLDRRPDLLSLAQKNIDKSPYRDRIHLIEGEALEILKDLDGKFDLIFLDGAKGHYMEFFNHSMRILNPGGLIIADNVLFRGMVASDNLLIRRKITIVKRLRKFLKYINEVPGYSSSIVPIGDGMALIYKKG